MAKYRQTFPLDPIDAAYIAGLIDGEGTITLSRRHRNENRQLVVTISSNERTILQYVKDVTGVGIVTKKRAYKASHSINYTYKLSNRQAIDLLQQLFPYFKSYKKHRAQLVLDKYLILTPRNGKYSQQLADARSQFIDEFFAINPGYG